MARTAEAYFASMMADLPTGPAWPRDRDGVMEAILYAAAVELADIEARGERLQEEADPRTALETIGDWERVLGLPDPCLGPSPDLVRRREAAWLKEDFTSGMNLAVYSRLAEGMGYAVTFREYRPFRCGRSRCAGTHTLGPADQVHKLRTTVAGPRKLRFRCGTGRCGRDPLTATIGGEDLVCVLRREMPAHLQKLFNVLEA